MKKYSGTSYHNGDSITVLHYMNVRTVLYYISLKMSEYDIPGVKRS